MFQTADRVDSQEDRLPRQTNRRLNHWAKLIPEDFVRYPRLEPLGYLAEARLIQRAQAGDLEARNEIWMHYARLVLAVINEFQCPDDLLPDAIQEGALGIKRAIEKFEIERLNSFSTYAWSWIRQHIQRFLATRTFTLYFPSHLFPDYLQYRRELQNCPLPGDAARLELRWSLRDDRLYRRILRIHALIAALPIHDVEPGNHPLTRDEEPDDSRPRAAICRELLNTLSPRDRDVLELRFGLSDGRERSLREIGEGLHITRERVRQLEKRAIQRLQQRALKLGYACATELTAEAESPDEA